MNENLMRGLKHNRMLSTLNTDQKECYRDKLRYSLDEDEKIQHDVHGIMGLSKERRCESYKILIDIQRDNVLEGDGDNKEDQVPFDKGSDDPFTYFGIPEALIARILEFAINSLDECHQFSLVSFIFCNNVKGLQAAWDVSVVKAVFIYKLTSDAKYLKPFKWSKHMAISLYPNNKTNMLYSMDSLCKICVNLRSVHIFGDLDGDLETVLNKIMMGRKIEELKLNLSKTYQNRANISNISNILQSEACNISRFGLLCLDLVYGRSYYLQFLNPEIVNSVDLLQIQYTHGLAKYLTNNVKNRRRSLCLLFGPKMCRFNSIDYKYEKATKLAIAINEVTITNQRGRSDDVINTFNNLWSKYHNISIQKDEVIQSLKKPI